MQYILHSSSPIASSIPVSQYTKFCEAVGSIYVKGGKTNPLSCGCVGISVRMSEAQGLKGVTKLARSYIDIIIPLNMSGG